MPQPQVTLFIDVQNRQLVRSATSTVPALLPVAYQGDTLNLTLRFLQATGTTPPYTDIDYSGAAVLVAAGEIGTKPTEGFFTITDTSASQVTSQLAYNATAAQVQTAIQAALTTNWSSATVLGANGGPYTITNGSNGVQTALIGTPVSLSPVSSVPITTLQAGTDTLPQMEYVQLSVNPVALQDTWTASFSPDVLTGTLSLATSGIEALIGENPFVCTSFSIQVTPSGENAFTAYQGNFTIENDLIVGAPSAPAPSVSYYTTTESDARYNSGVYVERNNTGDTDLSVSLDGVGARNVIYLLTDNESGTADFTFDNGTFDGQTVKVKTATSLNTVSYSDNVSISGVTSIYAGSSLTFAWDADNTVWIPIGC